MSHTGAISIHYFIHTTNNPNKANKYVLSLLKKWGKTEGIMKILGKAPDPSLSLKSALFISTQSKSRKLQIVLTDPREMLPGKDHKDNLHISETSTSQLHSRARKQHNVRL